MTNYNATSKLYSPDSDVFRARHPITTYEHYRELIQRIAAGEDKVITSERPLILAMTSGTSGPSAMLLSTKDTNMEFFLQVSPRVSLLDCCSSMLQTCVLFAGSDRVFGCHSKSIPSHWQPPAHHQVLLQTQCPLFRGWYSYWPKFLNASLVSTHAQPVHNPSSCLWGVSIDITYSWVFVMSCGACS